MTVGISYCFHQTFPEPLAMAPRRFESFYLLYASSGSFTLELANRRWLLPPQRAALIAPDVPIAVRSTRPATSSSVLFPTLPWTGSASVFPMTELARAMVLHAARWGADRAPDDAEANRFFAALGDVVTQMAARPEESWLPRPATPQIARTVAVIEARLDQLPTIADLAREAALSERSLTRRFDAELGMSPGQYANRARMIAAMDMLLAGDESITQIALATGFEGTSAFIRAFRRFTGVTPGRYRMAKA